jgi:hypothetical protein
LTHCGAIAGRWALKIYFCILPVAVLGSSRIETHALSEVNRELPI